jgi:hypothetical protein
MVSHRTERESLASPEKKLMVHKGQRKGAEAECGWKRRDERVLFSLFRLCLTNSTMAITRAATPVLVPPTTPKPKSLLTKVVETPYAPWTTSALLCVSPSPRLLRPLTLELYDYRLSAVPLTVKAPLGFPHLVQLPLFALIFGGSGCVLAGRRQQQAPEVLKRLFAGT